MFQRYFTFFMLGILRLASYLPLGVLHLFSNGMAILLFYVIRYRRGVVESNLQRSFPDKTSAQRRRIARRYYAHLGDLLVESLRSERMSEGEYAKRVEVLNPEFVNQYHSRGQSVVVLAMHYANWEWMLSLPLALNPTVLFVYKPLSNSVFDRHFSKVRNRFGGKVVSMSIALRKIIEAQAANEPVLTWLAADQAPPWFHKLWIRFLNQDTQFFDGPSKIAQRFNQPVLIQYVRRVKRGYYQTWFETLVEDPLGMDQAEILKLYANRMEAHIRLAPEFYLWSHRRWKHQRPADQSLS